MSVYYVLDIMFGKARMHDNGAVWFLDVFVNVFDDKVVFKQKGERVERYGVSANCSLCRPSEQ